MKKNITINLFGSLYAIDEDAYELLNQYQNNMRRYFSRKEGGEEIAEDIERRIAELFDELKASGVEAITIEHVRDIISRIGNPEEMDGAETETTADKQMMPQRKANAKKTYIRNCSAIRTTKCWVASPPDWPAISVSTRCGSVCS